MAAEPSPNIERTKRFFRRAILRMRCSTSKKVRSSSPSFPSKGREAIVAVLGADEFCGEGCLTGQPRHLATAAAMTECEIMRLEKSAMIRVLHKEPYFP